MGLRERTFDTGAVTINYAEGPPSGPPLIFLPGGSARWQSYEDILLDLAATFHLYAADFRGHGRSGRVPGCYMLQDYVDDTLALLREVVGEAAYLLGHSLGGQVGLMVAAQCAQYARAVVVGDSPLTRRTGRSGLGDSSRARLVAWRDLAGGRLSVDEIAEALKDAPTEIPGQDGPATMREKYGEASGIFAWLAATLYHNDPDMLTAVMEGATTAGYEMEGILPAIRCPVLLLQADPAAGGMMTDEEVERALPLLAKARHVRLEDTGHFIFGPEKEPALCAIIVEFLNSV